MLEWQERAGQREAQIAQGKEGKEEKSHEEECQHSNKHNRTVNVFVQEQQDDSSYSSQREMQKEATVSIIFHTMRENNILKLGHKKCVRESIENGKVVNEEHETRI